MQNYRINREIQAKIVKLVDNEGNFRDSVPIREALDIAKEAGFDLVEISSNVNPPVCKVIDYGKFQYQNSKNEKKKDTKQKKIKQKVIRFGLQISENDMDRKSKTAIKFLENGDKVRFELILKGREKAHKDFAKDKLGKIIDKVRRYVYENYEVKYQGNRFGVNLKPDLSKIKQLKKEGIL